MLNRVISPILSYCIRSRLAAAQQSTLPPQQLPGCFSPPRCLESPPPRRLKLRISVAAPLEALHRSRRPISARMDFERIEGLKVKFEHVLNEAQKFVQELPPARLYAAIGVVLLTIFVSLVVRLIKRISSNTIVLTGLSGSGKTVLFFQLQDGSTHQGTVTSMEPNEGTFVLHSEMAKKDKIKPVHILDVPGHSRLRPKLDEFLPQAASIVFVVDAVEFLPNIRAASEYLYDILTKAAVVKKKIPLLLLCNKVDKVTAHTKDFIRKQLEKEIDKLRISRTSLSSADMTSEYTLGVPGEAFTFSQCLNKVMVAEASGLTNDISQVEQFIRENVKP